MNWEKKENDIEDEVIKLRHYTWKRAEQHFIHMMESGEWLFSSFRICVKLNTSKIGDRCDYENSFTNSDNI